LSSIVGISKFELVRGVKDMPIQDAAWLMLINMDNISPA